MDPQRKAYLLSLTQLPQMTVNESLIAHQWLLKHADEFDGADFNVRLGSEVDLGPGYNDTIRRQAAILSQKRADIVATLGSEVTIVEVKLRVSLAALGQLLGYAILWRAEHPETTAVHLVAVGFSALVDAVELLHAHNINVEVFPDVTLVTLPKA